MNRRSWLIIFVVVVLIIQIYSFHTAQQAPNDSWHNYYIPYERFFSYSDMAIDSNSSIIIVGSVTGTNLPGLNSSQVSSSQDSNGGILKLNSNGSLLWSAYFGGPSTDYFKKVIVDSENNIIVLGYTYSHTFYSSISSNYTFGPPANYYYYYFIVKYSTTGTILWTTIFRNTNYNYMSDMKLGPNDSIILTEASSTSLGTTMFNASGNLISQSTLELTNYFSEARVASNLDLYVLEDYKSNSAIGYGINYALNKYSSSIVPDWSLNITALINNIYDLSIEVTPTNDVIVSGSFYNVNDSNNINYDYPDLGTFSIYVFSNGSINWIYKLYTLGDNAIDGVAFLPGTNNTIIVGDTDSNKFPTLNTDNKTFSGSIDITFTILNQQGKAIKRSIFGGSGTNYPLDFKIAPNGLLIIVAMSGTGSYKNSETIVFVMTPDGNFLDPVHFASLSFFNQISNTLVLVIPVLLFIFVLTVFNYYASNSSPNAPIRSNKPINDPSKGKSFSSIYCPNDGTRMQSYTSKISPNAEFTIDKDKIDLGLHNALAMKKILPYSAPIVKDIVLRFFDNTPTLEFVTLRAVQCPYCHFISATPIQSFSTQAEYTETTINQTKVNSSASSTRSIDSILPQGPSFISYINPFPSKVLAKEYFKSIATLNKEKINDLVRTPEITKLTTLSIIATALFPFQMNIDTFSLLSVGFSIVMYFLIIIISSYIYTAMLNTKSRDFTALDNFRLWGIIFWINLPISIVVFGTQQFIDPTIAIGGLAIDSILITSRILILLSVYLILLTSVTNIVKITNLIITIVVLLITAYIVSIILGLAVIISFFSFFI